VETLTIVLIATQGDFGGHFTQRQGWERYMDLELGLGRKGR